MTPSMMLECMPAEHRGRVRADFARWCAGKAVASAEGVARLTPEVLPLLAKLKAAVESGTDCGVRQIRDEFEQMAPGPRASGHASAAAVGAAETARVYVAGGGADLVSLTATAAAACADAVAARAAETDPDAAVEYIANQVWEDARQQAQANLDCELANRLKPALVAWAEAITTEFSLPPNAYATLSLVDDPSGERLFLALQRDLGHIPQMVLDLRGETRERGAP